MATVSDLKSHVDEILVLLRQLVTKRQIRDRRLVLISLTAAGQEAFVTLTDDVRLKVGNLLGCLTDDEQCSFVHLIGRIVGVMSSSSATPEPEKTTP